MNHRFKFLFKVLPFLAGIMGVSLPVQALEHWNIPIEREMKTVHLTNRDSQPHTVWLSGPIEEYREPLEISFEVQAFGTLEIPLMDFKNWSWIHLKTQDPGQFQVQVQTIYEVPFTMNSGPASRWKGRVRPNSSAVILNLSPAEQTLTLTNQSITQIHKVPGLGKIRLPLDAFAAGSMLTVEGDSRIAAVIIVGTSTKALTADNTPKVLKPSSATPTSRYFLMANSNLTQSFVFETADAAVLASIQRQLQSPLLYQGRILIGQISEGHNNMNRDFKDPRKTPWSWNVSRAIKFAEFASQECDGSPEMLEEVLKPWLNSKVNICFWNYRVKQELSLEEVRSGIIPPK